MAEATADIALIGLAVMGQNLVLNMDDHGFEVVVYNRTISKTKAFLEREGAGRKISGVSDIPELVARLKKPRRVMMLVKAGKPRRPKLRPIAKPINECGRLRQPPSRIEPVFGRVCRR